MSFCKDKCGGILDRKKMLSLRLGENIFSGFFCRQCKRIHDEKGNLIFVEGGVRVFYFPPYNTVVHKP